MKVPAPVQEAAPKPPPEDEGATIADFYRAVTHAVRNMARSGAFDNPNGGKYNLMVTHVVNTTKNDVDVLDVAEKIRTEAAASKKVTVVSGKREEGKKFIAPEISLSGRITERTGYVRGKRRQEYYLQLNLADARTGTALSEAVVPVVVRQAEPAP